jgi:hypothetical protein
MVDLEREVARRAHVEPSFDLPPWKRAYDGAPTDPDSCVFSTAMTDERKPLFKWVTPLFYNYWTLLGLKSRHLRLAKLEDTRPEVIGVYQGDVREAYLRARGLTFEPVLKFHTVALAIACNIAIPDATIRRLNVALAQLRAERGGEPELRGAEAN